MIQAERDDLNIAEAQMLAREYLLADDSTLTKAAQDLKWQIAWAVLTAARVTWDALAAEAEADAGARKIAERSLVIPPLQQIQDRLKADLRRLQVEIKRQAE